MSMTDPISDFLTRIRNGIMARKDSVDCPRSKIKLAVAEILKQEGYLDAVTSVEHEIQGLISVRLRYDDNYVNAIRGIRRVSRPGQRSYVWRSALQQR